MNLKLGQEIWFAAIRESDGAVFVHPGMVVNFDEDTVIHTFSGVTQASPVGLVFPSREEAEDFASRGP